MTTAATDAEIESRAREAVKAPYRRLLSPDPDAGFLAVAPDLPGCMTDGSTEEEALRHLDEAMLVWMEAAIAAGRQIPAPAPLVAPVAATTSGRLLVRMPRSLHARLLERAEAEGVSANQLVVAAIAREVG